MVIVSPASKLSAPVADSPTCVYPGTQTCRCVCVSVCCLWNTRGEIEERGIGDVQDGTRELRET